MVQAADSRDFPLQNLYNALTLVDGAKGYDGHSSQPLPHKRRINEESTMKKTNTSIITAGLLASILLAASPFALADHHGERKGHHGKQDMAEMCEDFREGKGRFDQDKRHEKMEERRANMAERLQLTDKQLEIWADIHEERRAKHEQRREKMLEKMQDRCDALEK